MTLHRLHLPTRKTGRNRRSMLEHLLRMEEEAVKEAPEIFFSYREKKRQKEIFQQYTTEHQLPTFTYETIQEYLLTSIEQKTKKNEATRGIYTSVLVEQIEGDTPLVIDLQGKNFNYILRGLNTPRHITIQNTNSHYVGEYAGSYQGNTNIHFKNINGSWTGYAIGSYNGNATATFENINGIGTGWEIGSNNGSIIATFQNINGELIGTFGGHRGNSTIVAYNIIGKNSFHLHEGVLILVNPNEEPKIEGITNRQTKAHVRQLIRTNASPQEILDYIEANK